MKGILKILWFTDPVTDIIGIFSSWLGSRIFTFGNVMFEGIFRKNVK